MKKQFTQFKSLVAAVLVGVAGTSANAVSLEQFPVSDYWFPVGPVGTTVYANSFVAPVSGNVTGLGTWLNTLVADATTTLKFQIWGSVGGNPASGPDVSNVLATTADLSGFSGPSSFYSGAATGSVLAGQTYWFAISAIGSNGIGEYQVSDAIDDLGDGGSFWYWNASSSSSFDGQNLTPEMAFGINIDERHGVPDGGASGLMLGSALMALVAMKRKLQSA